MVAHLPADPAAVPCTEHGSAQHSAPLPGLEHMDLALVFPTFSTLIGKSQIFSQDRWEVKKREFIYQQLLKFPLGEQNSIWRIEMREKHSFCPQLSLS